MKAITHVWIIEAEKKGIGWEPWDSYSGIYYTIREQVRNEIRRLRKEGRTLPSLRPQKYSSDSLFKE